MYFKSNAQRKAVMSGIHRDKKAETMMSIKSRWSKKNKERYEDGKISKEKYLEEQNNLNNGEYNSLIEEQADFIEKNNIQLNPM